MDTSLLMTLSAECVCFLRACLLGAALGAFYDVFRILRRAFKCHGAIIAAQDLFYCFVACYATFVFLLTYCEGRLRWFVFFGLLIGWVLFRFTIGNLFVAAGSVVLKMIIRLIKALLHMLFVIINLFISPFLFVWRILKVQVLQISKKYLDIFKKVCQNRKYRLKKQAGLLYNRYIPHNSGKLYGKGQRGRGRGKAKKT